MSDQPGGDHAHNPARVQIVARTPAWEGAAVPFALRAVSEGLSANQFVAALREGGMGMRRQTALRVYGQARALAAEYGAEPGRPLGRAPTASESRPWPTRDSTGVLQTVQLFYIEAVTGNVLSRFYSVKTARGVTREEAIRRAVSAYQAAPPAAEGGSAPSQAAFAGAVHTGTALLYPQVEAA